MIRATRIRSLDDLIAFSKGAALEHQPFLPVRIEDAQVIVKQIIDRERMARLEGLKLGGGRVSAKQLAGAQ